MVWKLVYMSALVGMLEVDTYSDLNECREMAREMAVALNEGGRWIHRDETRDLNLQGELSEAYGCIPVPD